MRRRYAVTSDVRTRRLVVAEMLAAIALDQGREPAAAPPSAAASSAFGIEMRAAAAEASGYASDDERLWLGAAVVALVTATWATRFRTNVEVTT